MIYKPSKYFLLSVGSLFLTFFTMQGIVIPSITGQGGLAQTISVKQIIQKTNTYNLAPSKTSPGTFNFNYVFATPSKKTKQKFFDAPITPFDAKKAGIGTEAIGIRDAWGYPVRENFYDKAPLTEGKSNGSKAIELSSGKTSTGAGGAKNLDADPWYVGFYNCRANTNVNGYFKAYFEDMALNTNTGYDDPTHGTGRREVACQVLQDISEMIKLDETDVKPDILFMANPDLPWGALGAASSYFGYYSDGPDDGALHKHILSHVDPRPGQGDFDAFVMTGFDNVDWDVDSTLNPSTYNMYSVLYHEVMHTLGFRGLLPAVISSTNEQHQYDTFDFFSYKDPTLSTPFISNITEFLNVPVGAPSPWFTTNSVVYRGVKNFIGAAPDNILPVYSPAFWEQGSSLSHFDMLRAPGEVYVMNPSIDTDTIRPIHNDEKEVLCHLGYQVEGIQGCEGPTPVAANDVLLLPLPGEHVCIKPLANDTSFGGSLAINSLTPTSMVTGDTISYYSSLDCTFGLLPSATGAKSIYFTPAPGTDIRMMEYSNKDYVSNRTSRSAQIALFSCGPDIENYVCNGDFELAITPTPGESFYLVCPPSMQWDTSSYLSPYWFPYFCAGDLLSLIFGIESTPAYFSLINGNYMADVNENFPWAFITELRQPVLSGEQYTLSFDVRGNQNPYFDTFVLGFRSTPGFADGDDWTNTTPLEQMIHLQPNATEIPDTDWMHFERDFTANGDYEYFVMGSSLNKYFLDNISIKIATNEPYGNNIIQGKVYQDQNSNGVINQNEPGLDGIEVGLYQAGNAVPLQTVTTENIPNLGHYEFNNLADATYYVAQVNENIYQGITQPSISLGLVSGHSYVHTVSVLGGQNNTGNDFGVVLAGGLGNTDIQIKKTLIDSSLSLFDRYITWRVLVKNIGTEIATNVVVQDTLPVGILYFSHLTPTPNSYNGATGVLAIPSLAPGAQTYIDITTKVPNSIKVCGTKTNTANLVSLDQLDTYALNNHDIASITLRPCNPGPVLGNG